MPDTEKQRSNSSQPDSEPVTEKADKSNRAKNDNQLLDPTRYGDWEIGGRCIDF